MNRLFLWALLLPLLCSSTLSAQSTQTWASPCTLDVVFVAFRDTTAKRDTSVAYNYYNYDQPYGNNSGEPDSSYTIGDFRRMLTGGYDGVPAFVGSTQTVSGGHQLPQVYGSVRTYFDSVSSDTFDLHVRLINPADTDSLPRWVELPEIKEHYAEISINSFNDDEFWNDARAAAQDSVDIWHPNTTEFDIPDSTYN